VLLVCGCHVVFGGKFFRNFFIANSFHRRLDLCIDDLIQPRATFDRTPSIGLVLCEVGTWHIIRANILRAGWVGRDEGEEACGCQIQRAGIEKARFLDLCQVLLLALNRAVAAGKTLGPEAGLAELSNIPDSAKLSDYPFYPAAQGEFQFLSGRLTEAAKHFDKAMNLARTKPETIFFQKKIEACRPGLAKIDR
jgi:hypothetical protein